MNKNGLYIVVVTFNSGDCLAPFLTSILNQSFLDWHMIVIDNASHDTTVMQLSAVTDPRISIVANPKNLGFAAAVNSGLRTAAAEGASHFLLLNPDTELPPLFLAEFLAEWRELAADVLAPRIMLRDTPEKSWYAGGGFDRGWLFTNRHDDFQPGDSLESRQVEFASGCCLGLTRLAIEKVGLLDESYFVYWEDADYCLRLIHAGIPIWYAPRLKLLHEGGASSGGDRSATAMRLFHCSYSIFLRKHFGLGVAARALLRVVGREIERPARQWRVIARTAIAMVRGLWLPRVDIPRL